MLDGSHVELRQAPVDDERVGRRSRQRDDGSVERGHALSVAAPAARTQGPRSPRRPPRGLRPRWRAERRHDRCAATTRRSSRRRRPSRAGEERDRDGHRARPPGPVHDDRAVRPSPVGSGPVAAPPAGPRCGGRSRRDAWPRGSRRRPRHQPGSVVVLRAGARPAVAQSPVTAGTSAPLPNSLPCTSA